MRPHSNPAEFEGRRVLVTGGSKGAGRATVQRFLDAEAWVMTATRHRLAESAGADFVGADLRGRTERMLLRGQISMVEGAERSMPEGA